MAEGPDADTQGDRAFDAPKTSAPKTSGPDPVSWHAGLRVQWSGRARYLAAPGTLRHSWPVLRIAHIWLLALASVVACRHHANHEVSRDAVPAEGGAAETSEPAKRSGLQMSFAVDVGGAADARSRKSLVARTVDIVRQRVAKLPMTISVVSDGETIKMTIRPDQQMDQIHLVEARELATKRSRLALQLVETADAHAGALVDFARQDPAARAAGIAVGDDEWTVDGGTHHERYLTAADASASFDIAAAKARDCWREDKMVVGDQVECKVTGRERIEHYLEQTLRTHAQLAPTAGFALGFERVSSGHDPITRRHTWRTHYLRSKPLADNGAVAQATVDRVPGAGWMRVVIHLTPEARERLEQILLGNPGGKLAVVVDGVVLAAPTADKAIRKDTIMVPVNESSLVAQQQAEILAYALSAGPLPAALTRTSNEIVPP